MSEKTECGTCSKQDCAAAKKRPDENDRDFQERQSLAKNLCGIKRKILVLSGKGGVGKSTVSINLAAALAMEGFKTGLLDIDIHGPSIPFVFKSGKDKIEHKKDGRIIPPEVMSGLKVMSVGFFLEDQSQALIWRGPMKMSAIKQFLSDVQWGELDFMIVDCPPGTGDEPLSVCQLMSDINGAVVVTTPQNMALADVRKSITFCEQLNIPVIGIIENMSGFKCPCCGNVTDIFESDGGKNLSEETGIPFLGKIPIEPGIVKASEDEKTFVGIAGNSETGKAFMSIVDNIRKNLNNKK